MKSSLLSPAAAAILLAGAAIPLGSVHAMGGGGGGGGQMPTVTAPQYDPVQEYRRGAAALQAGKYKDAAAAFEHVTEMQPKVAAVWYLLGQAKTGAGDLKGAAHAYERAVKLDPAPIEPQRDFAVALAKLKQKDKAAAQLDALKAKATACNDACPQAADLKAAIAAVEAALAGSDTAQLAAPPSLLFATDQQGDAAYVRAVSLINERRYDEALAALAEAQKAFGPHPDILTYQGYVWRKLGALDRAESFYRAALAIAPTHRGATEYYGELKVIRGDLTGAKQMLARLETECRFGCAEAEELRRWIDRGGDPSS
jgi:tetratricopeptide (TPR) repeat protein